MEKQLLVYERVVPLTIDSHKDLRVTEPKDYGFTRSLRFVPILLAEFKQACEEYPIVFVEGKDQWPMPVAVLSMDDKNRFIDEDGQWLGRYMPAFIRRYPYVFSKDSDGDMYYLCIDDASDCTSTLDDQGERIFTDDGDQTEYIQKILEFLRVYQVEHARTESFGKHLKELNVLETKQLSSTIEIEGEKRQEVRLNGFLTVDQSRIQTLTDDKLVELLRSGEYDIIGSHWRSLDNFNNHRFN